MDTRKLTAEAIARQGSLYKVAKAAGVSYQAAHAWKKGTSTPSGNNLLKLLELAGVGVKLSVVFLSIM